MHLLFRSYPHPVGGYDVSGDNIATLRIRTITLPYAALAAGPNSVTTGYMLRNISGPTTAATVNVKYYNVDGSLKNDSRTITLTPGEVEGYHQSNDTFLTMVGKARLYWKVTMISS